MFRVLWWFRAVRVAIGCALVALSTAPVAAQDTGSISGVVVDNQDQVVPGATVTLTNERTLAVRSTTTNTRGEFAFQAVPPGIYAAKVELSGFRTAEQTNNVLNASSQLNLGRLRMDVGAVSEVVTVVAEGSVVETKNSDYSGLLTSTQISQIQTKGRDVMSMRSSSAPRRSTCSITPSSTTSIATRSSMPRGTRST